MVKNYWTIQLQCKFLWSEFLGLQNYHRATKTESKNLIRYNHRVRELSKDQLLNFRFTLIVFIHRINEAFHSGNNWKYTVMG